MNHERLDPETATLESIRAQARAARVLHTYADPGTRKLAVLEAQRAKVMAYISQSSWDGDEEPEVTYYCTGCRCVVGEGQGNHRLHGTVTRQ